MRYPVLILSMILCSSPIFTQEECERVVNLTGGTIYNTAGTARLVELADGSLELRFDEDFDADEGPDVQIFLSNDSTSIAGGVMIEDIGTTDGISHFKGAITFDVPDGVELSSYEFIVLRCITFRAYWGGGRLGPNSCDGSGGGGNGGGSGGGDEDNCEETAVATTGWVSAVTVCPNDGASDAIPLMNTSGLMAGDDYAYIIADDNNRIKSVIFQDTIDFEGSGLETEYVFGVSYSGTLVYEIGDPINSITSDSCAILSSLTNFLTVTKENCGQSFECFNTNTATTNWVSEVTICPDDGEPDVIPFLNNQFIEPGDNFAYLLTDEDQNLMEVLRSTSYDFEGSGSSSQRIYAISYDGELSYSIGAPIQSITAENCAVLSDSVLFLTINKGGCSNDLVSVGGSVRSPDDRPIQGVEIVDAQGRVLATSESDGTFTISSLEPGTDLSLSARTTSTLSANGISSTDLVLVVRHILSFSRFDNPYQVLAADANNSGGISASDLVQMKRVLLELSDDFVNNASWRFIDASQDLEMNIANGQVIESITIQNISSDTRGIDFIGVKIGDVNNSADLDLR